MKRLVVLAAPLVLSLVACTAAQKKPIIETAGDADAAQRRSTFEATARVLDERPEWVDEFWYVTKQHPKMRTRFLADAAADLDDVSLASQVAENLVDHPDAVTRVFVATLDAAKDRPQACVALRRAMIERSKVIADIETDSKVVVTTLMEATVDATKKKPAARDGMNRALADRATTIAEIQTDSPEAVIALMKATTNSVSQKPPARDAMLQAMRESAPKLAEILADDPKTLAVVTKALMSKLAEEDEQALKEMLRSMPGALADEPK